MNRSTIYKRRELGTVILVATVIVLLFWLPQSSTLIYDEQEANKVLEIFKFARLLLFPTLVILVFLNKAKLKISRGSFIEYLIIFGIFLLNLVFNQVTNVAMLWMIVCLFGFDIIADSKLNTNAAKKVLNVGFYISIVYFIIYTGKAGRRAGSWLDPNIAGFFYFLLFYYFSKIGKKLQAVLTMCMGIMTFSRLFFLVILVHLFLNLKLVKWILAKFKVKTILYCFVSFFGLYIVSKIYVDYFSNNYVFGYSNSLTRLNLSGLIDESNFFRCYSNLVYFSYLNIIRFIFGYDKTFYKSVQTIRTPILPHNLFLSLLVNFGVVITLIYVLKIRRIHSVYQKWDLFFPVLIYYTFLGTSSYYGFEIMLQMLIVKIIESEIKKK